MVTKTISKVTDLVPDPRNANKHSTAGTLLLQKALEKNGFGRSILISNDDVIIAGNGVSEAAASVGLDNVRVIETNGQEIIALKRTDVQSGTKEFFELALGDNIIAKSNIVMDAVVTNAICEEFKLEDYKIAPATISTAVNFTAGPKTKITLKYDEATYASVSARLQKVISDNGIEGNENAIIRLLDMYDRQHK